MKQKALTILLLLFTIFPIGRIVWQKWDYYLSPFDLKRAQGLYNISQYVKGEGASWIADEIVLAYASWNYINGGSPILLNPDYPPLGKYIVGSSIYLFNNEKLPNLFFSFASLFAFFLLSRLVLKNICLSLIPVALLSWERLFSEQLLFVPLFETFVFTFLILATYFFVKGLKNNNYFILSSLFLGCFWATKPWMMAVPLVLAYAVYLLIIKKGIKKFIFWSFSLPMAVIVILISYLKLFLEGWNFYKVLSVQKWIMWYHSSKLLGFGSVWPFIYLNRWYVWWGDKPFLPIAQWTVAWPVFLTLALICCLAVALKHFGLKNKLTGLVEPENIIYIICLQVICYLGFYTFGYMSTRYIFYFMPFCYLLGVYFLVSIIQWKKLLKSLF